MWPGSLPARSVSQRVSAEAESRLQHETQGWLTGQEAVSELSQVLAAEAGSSLKHKQTSMAREAAPDFCKQTTGC